MAKAIYNGEVIAESAAFEEVEATYFPLDSLRAEFFVPSTHTTVCGWEGTARYYDVAVCGERNPGAAWYCPEPKPAAANIVDHVAFWRRVTAER